MSGFDLVARSLKIAGKPVLGCFPLYPPLELFHSMGYNPVVLWGLKQFFRSTPESDKHVQNFACSVSRHLFELIISESGKIFEDIFFYNACDTLRNLPELIAAALEKKGRQTSFTRMHLPMQGIEGPAGVEFFKNEIARLVLFLEKRRGVPFSPEKFEQSVQLYRQLREACVKLQELVASGQYSFVEYAKLMQEGIFLPVEKATEFVEARVRSAQNEPVRDCKTARVVLSGIMTPSPAITHAIEEAGFIVAGNDIAGMQRSIGYTPARCDDVREYYVDFYTNHCPCSTLLFTADRRIDYLIGMVKATQAKGVIFLGEKFCDSETLEFPFIEDKLKGNGIHVLTLEQSVDDRDNIAPTINRINAFAELLHDAVER
ncbi:MAG TPA: 2-hydroxyacyl-CoA dehydratase family protein [Candidatus Lokiarchaeia archaeon]|nr:2-hydroxyacyl-CoA dehydratase family protein [Candidatus Lokiarchaeia archaeon]